jgi:hypothetical protein
MVRQEVVVGAVLYSAEVWHFLWSESLHWASPNQTPISSVALAKEDESLNNVGEAYTENHAGRKGVCSFLKQFSLVTSIKAAGEGVIFPEAKTKEPTKVRFQRGCRGLRAWHVWREVSGTWDASFVPAKTGRRVVPKRKHAGYRRGVRSSIVLRGGRADHKGKETTLLRSLHREYVLDMVIQKMCMSTSKQGIACRASENFAVLFNFNGGSL